MPKGDFPTSQQSRAPLTVVRDAAGTVLGLADETGGRAAARAALAAEQAGSGIPSITASRSLTKADCQQPLRCESASAIVLTIENDATAKYVGSEAHVAYQAGAGAVSFAAGPGVTLRGTAPTAAQYASQGVMRVGANEWACL